MRGADDEREKIAKEYGGDWFTEIVYAALDDGGPARDEEQRARFSRAYDAIEAAGGTALIEEVANGRTLAAAEAVQRVLSGSAFAAYVDARVAAAERRRAQLAKVDERDFEGVDQADDPNTLDEERFEAEQGYARRVAVLDANQDFEAMALKAAIAAIEAYDSELIARWVKD